MQQQSQLSPGGKKLLDLIALHGIDAQAEALPDPQRLKRLADVERSQSNGPDEVIRHRFLCRQGSLLLVGPTGIGKSSFSLQCAILWASGVTAFGLEPARPLRTLLCQAENDEGDLAEFRDGVCRGLDLNEETVRKGLENIFVLSEKSKTGAELCITLEALMVGQNYDLVIIDPALAYLGGDSNKGADVSRFLRNELNPVLEKANVGCVLIHHTVKPPREKGAQWRAGDLAYLGSGSAEFANWARAVLALQSVGSHDVYKLVVGKRGKRLRWTDDDANAITHRWIAHHGEPGVICWRLAEPDEYAKYDKDAAAAATAPGVKVAIEQRIANLWNTPDEGLSKDVFVDRAKAAGIHRATAYRWWSIGVSKNVFRIGAGEIAKLTHKWNPRSETTGDVPASTADLLMQETNF